MMAKRSVHNGRMVAKRSMHNGLMVGRLSAHDGCMMARHCVGVMPWNFSTAHALPYLSCNAHNFPQWNSTIDNFLLTQFQAMLMLGCLSHARACLRLLAAMEHGARYCHFYTMDPTRAIHW